MLSLATDQKKNMKHVVYAAQGVLQISRHKRPTFIMQQSYLKINKINIHIYITLQNNDKPTEIGVLPIKICNQDTHYNLSLYINFKGAIT